MRPVWISEKLQRKILPVSWMHAVARQRLNVVSDGDIADVLGFVSAKDPKAHLEKEVIRRGGRYWFRMRDDWPSLPLMRDGALERLRLAEWVLVPTPQLAEACQQDIPGIRVHAYEEAVDVDRVRERTKWEGTNLPEVVWTGNPRNAKHLRLLQEPLIRAYEKRPFRLHIVCNQPPSRDWKMPVRWTRYSFSRETDNLSSAAVGLAVTPDDRFHGAKGMYKCKTYLAAGVPVLAPGYGFFVNIVRDGETGFICRTVDEWVDRLCLLLEDHELNRRIGSQARDLACRHYSFDVLAPKWVQELGEMMAGRQPPSPY